MSNTYQESVERTIIAAEQLHQIVNGIGSAEVPVEDGSKIPSIRKALLDNFYFKEPLAWQQGQNETVFNQLRKTTDGLMWYAPNASTATPVPMGVVPTNASGWRIYSADAIVKLSPTMLAALKRTYREVGLELVSGSFEEGAVVTNVDDVVLQSTTGKCFNWQGSLPKTIPNNSTPEGTGGIGIGKWQDVTNTTQHSQAQYSDGVDYETYYAWQGDVTLHSKYEAVQFSAGGIFYRWDGVFPQGGLVISQNTPEPSPNQTGTGKYVAVLDLAIKDTILSMLKDPSGTDLIGYLAHLNLTDKLGEIVSLADFSGSTHNEQLAAAKAYLASTSGTGGLFIPKGIWKLTLDFDSNLFVFGAGEKSVIQAATTGTGSYAVKMSNSVVGAYPYGAGKTPIKHAKLANLKIDANGADFGIYAAYCLFPELESITITRAKVRNLYMTAVFSYSLDKILLSDCQSVGGSMGENLFNWTGGEEGIICNAGNSRRLLCYGNGLNGAYDKTHAPKEGAGFLVRGGSGNTFTSFQGEQNTGTGLYVGPQTQCTFYGVYLEANAKDGTQDNRQVVNESSGAVFYDVEPRFLITDTFHAIAATRIFNYLGNRITGQGLVSLYGKFNAVSVETPNVHTMSNCERVNVNTGAGRQRVNMLKPAPRATEAFYKTLVWEMGVYVAFRSTVTVGTGPTSKTVVVYDVSGSVLDTMIIPSGTYNNGDIIYVKFSAPDISLNSAIDIGFGGGANIATVDFGVYTKFMV